MKLLKTVAEYRDYYLGLQMNQGHTSIGFVPTMGALHQGHLSLVARSQSECACTVVSIYVNPTQFNNPADLANYPDTLGRDLEVLGEHGVDAVFLPTYQELYPDDFAYKVEENRFSNLLCGAHRPGHFTGVLTVVMKLLNIVRPAKAFFGEKDFQQLTLVRNMTEAFFMDVEIVACPTVRESDGLAMSSRNLNLNAGDRERSPRLISILRSAACDTSAATLLQKEGFIVDYVTTVAKRRYAAVTVGDSSKSVRLIDNVALEAI